MVAQELSAALSHVELEGGPSHLCGPVKLTELDEVIFSEQKIKIRYLNGYEHYESTGTPLRMAEGSAASAPVKFRWTGRTKIAE
ncbi:hypothetical protein GCM10027074_78300 [Streptomyces deserti]